jgi:formiminotetrahydrofolate cyclodeaminase
MAVPGLGARALAECGQPPGRSAVRDDALDRRKGGADARHLRLRLVAAPDHAERAGTTPREMAGCHAARRARPKLTEPVGLDHADERRGLRVEQAYHEGGAARRGRVQLPPGEPESVVGRGHIGQGSLRQTKPSAGSDLDLASSHAAEAGFDGVDRIGRRDERLDVALREVERHRPESRNRIESAVDSSRLTTDDYLQLQLGDLLDRLSADGLAPGGGSAAALTVAFGAKLVAMVARCSPAWDDASGVVAQANMIGERAVELAQTDGLAWEEALTALRDAEAFEGRDPKRDFVLERKLEAAAAAPLEIAALGADTTALAALAAECGEATYRADAAAAAALAAGGATAAAHLVRVNLGVRRTDPRLARALASEEAAHDVAARLLESHR